jgi:hypothetical protein
MLLAERLNAAGMSLEAKGRFGPARLAFRSSSFLAPAWPAPVFNLGLLAKRDRRWDEARALNRRAAELDPNSPPAWWNLGIAATALGDWKTARLAWSRYGIDVPEGEGPIEMDLGLVPIRLRPLSLSEVVWCRRIDPARAVVLSVPTPESGRGYWDTVLHDGEPRGSRQLDGAEVSVFDEIQLLAPGRLHTFAARVTAPAHGDVEALAASCRAGEHAVEDWEASVRWLCRRCSEGSPHAHDGACDEEWVPERTVAVAARSEDAARSLLETWAAGAEGRHVGGVDCVLRRE